MKETRDLLTGIRTNTEQPPLPREDTMTDHMVVAVVSFLTGLAAGLAIMIFKRWLHG